MLANADGYAKPVSDDTGSDGKLSDFPPLYDT